LGWHAIFGLAIPPLVLVAIVFVIFAREAPGSVKPASAADFFAILAERDTYLFGLFYGVTFGGFVGLSSFLSILLHDQYGISKIAAGDLTSPCVVAGSFQFSTAPLHCWRWALGNCPHCGSPEHCSSY